MPGRRVHDVAERGGGERAGRLGDDPVALVELEHLDADPALGDRQQRRAAVAHDREGDVAGPPHRRAVDEGVERVEHHRPAGGERRGHRGRARRLDADDARRRARARRAR